MFTVDREVFDSIIESKMDNNDKIDALDDLKRSIKKHRLGEAKYYGGITLLSGSICGVLSSIDHTLIDTLMGRNVGNVSNIDLIVGGAEAVAGI